MAIRYEIFDFTGLGAISSEDQISAAEIENDPIASGKIDAVSTSWKLAWQNDRGRDALAIMRNATQDHLFAVAKTPPDLDAPSMSIVKGERRRRIIKIGYALYLRMEA